MRTRRPTLSRRNASRMLDDPAAHAGDGGLGELLSAAAHPRANLSREHEEQAAAVFRSVAGPGSVPNLGGNPVMSRFTRKIAAAPAAAFAAVGMVVAGGGIALAASQGSVHVPFTGHDNRASAAPSASATVNPGLTHTPSAEPSDDATDESPSAAPSATPSPSLDGLCVAYQAGAMAKAATNPAFTALTTAAGGAGNIDAYCTARIGAPRTHPATPTHPAKPTQAATPHQRTAPTHPAVPTGLPDVAESAAPSSH